MKKMGSLSKWKGLKFTKMHATGNDFILIDEFNSILIPDEKKPEFVRSVSHRNFGVGSDGVIFIQSSDKTDVKFLFYNPDGSLAEMCGNGIRCFSKYVYEKEIVAKKNFEVETLAGIVAIEIFTRNEKVEKIKVNMGKPKLLRKDIPVSGNKEETFINRQIEINGKNIRITAISMGNPHAVIFVEDVAKVDVIELGRKIRHLKIFPKGVNVHFVQKISEQEFKIRSYERGVENETLACGSGICASAVSAYLNGLTSSQELKFHALGGSLEVELNLRPEGEVKEVYLIGDAEYIFEGKLL